MWWRQMHEYHYNRVNSSLEYSPTWHESEKLTQPNEEEVNIDTVSQMTNCVRIMLGVAVLQLNDNRDADDCKLGAGSALI